MTTETHTNFRREINLPGFTPFSPDQVQDYIIGHRAIGLLEVFVDYDGDIDHPMLLRFAKSIVESYRKNHQPSAQESSLSEQPGPF